MEQNFIRYRFEGPIPEARFSRSQVSRLLGIAETLTKPDLPEGLEEMAFAVVARMVLGILIDGPKRAHRGPSILATGRTDGPAGSKPGGK